jgi:hypothetical protein
LKFDSRVDLKREGEIETKRGREKVRGEEAVRNEREGREGNGCRGYVGPEEKEEWDEKRWKKRDTERKWIVTLGSGYSSWDDGRNVVMKVERKES